MKLLVKLENLDFVWDKFLPAGRVQWGIDRRWHIGEGTDLQALIFKASLSEFDKRMLSQMKIEVD
jgi:hypothetical protein